MAMAPHQAQRTLVKSRPELWAEVSDVASLCKHLGEFGDITITRLEPETTVAWEGTAARGTVELEASGWGTKVTLTAELLEVDVPQPDAVPAPEPVAEVQPEPEPEPEPVAVAEPEPEPVPVAVAEAEPEPAPQPEAVAEREPKPAPRGKPGFFARLFGKKPATAPLSAAERAAARAAAQAPTPTPAAAEPVVTPVADDPSTPLRALPDLEPEPGKVVPLRQVPAEPAEPTEPDEPDPNPPLVAQDVPPAPADPAPQPTALLDEDQALAVLTSALDDLGAAHRRPFSHS
ncbi:MAG: hypothetical protein JWO02_283 [Solirubrobacterales bacterium]|nr:hypothetical protein [Solirubrobacterales bacterium]